MVYYFIRNNNINNPTLKTKKNSKLIKKKTLRFNQKENTFYLGFFYWSYKHQSLWPLGH